MGVVGRCQMSNTKPSVQLIYTKLNQDINNLLEFPGHITL